MSSVPIYRYGFGEVVEDYIQHFYPPSELVNYCHESEVSPMVLPGGEVVLFTKRDFAVVANGL